MKTKISKKFRKIQTLAVVLTLSFTGIPVSPVWAGDSTALTGQKETAQPVKSVTPAKRVPAALPKASTYTGDLVPPGPLSKAAVTKAPTNFKASVTTPTLMFIQDMDDTVRFKFASTSKLHLELLKQAYKISRLYKVDKEVSFRNFSDGAGALAAQVQYHTDGTTKIVYPVDPVGSGTFSYDYPPTGTLPTCEVDAHTGNCYYPFLNPTVINPGSMPPKMNIAFYNTQASLKKFLDTYFTKAPILRTLENHQVTVYKDGGGNQVAWVDVVLDPSSGKQTSATYNFNNTRQAFTYGSNKTLAGYDTNAPEFPPVPGQPPTPAYTVPDFIWNIASSKHLDYLKRAYKESSASGNTRTFLDGAGKVAATVYYEGAVSNGKIKAIVYRDSAFAYFYNTGTKLFIGCKDPNNPNDSGACYAPPMTPKFSSDGKKLIRPLFYGKLQPHTDFLGANYSRRPVTSLGKDYETTEYRNKTGDLVAKLEIKFNKDATSPDSKPISAVITYKYPDHSENDQVFTYNSQPNPPNALTSYTGPRE